MKKHLMELKSLFREWYGLLSINEIMTNQPLIAKLEKIEIALSQVINGGAET